MNEFFKIRTKTGEKENSRNDQKKMKEKRITIPKKEKFAINITQTLTASNYQTNKENELK